MNIKLNTEARLMLKGILGVSRANDLNVGLIRNLVAALDKLELTPAELDTITKKDAAGNRTDQIDPAHLKDIFDFEFDGNTVAAMKHFVAPFKDFQGYQAPTVLAIRDALGIPDPEVTE